MSDKEWEKISEKWLDDEEDDDNEVPSLRDSQGNKIRDETGEVSHVDPAEVPRPKTEMIFVTVNTLEKDDTTNIARAWTDLLHTNALSPKLYAVEENKILVVIQGDFESTQETLGFLLNQSETLGIEWNQQKFYPKGLDEEAVKIADEKVKMKKEAKEKKKKKSKKKKKKSKKKKGKKQKKPRWHEDL